MKRQEISPCEELDLSYLKGGNKMGRQGTDFESVHLIIRVIEEKPETKVYEVLTKDEEFLGIIKWHGPWRKYIFFPDDKTMYDSNCMRMLAGFIDDMMEERK